MSRQVTTATVFVKSQTEMLIESLKRMRQFNNAENGNIFTNRKDHYGLQYFRLNGNVYQYVKDSTEHGLSSSEMPLPQFFSKLDAMIKVIAEENRIKAEEEAKREAERILQEKNEESKRKYNELIENLKRNGISPDAVDSHVAPDGEIVYTVKLLG